MIEQNSKLTYGRRFSIFTKQFFKDFRALYPNITLTDAEIKALCREGNQIMQDSIIEDPTGFRIPFFLGHVCITRFKSDNIAYDNRYSSVYKKPVPHTNTHTFGYRFAIRHFRLSDSKRIAPMMIYKLIPTRAFKRRFAKHLKDTGGEHYLNFKTNDFISKKKINKLRNLNYSEWD
jgi:hypothetical protein